MSRIEEKDKLKMDDLFLCFALDIFEKMSNKIAASKEKYQTYLLPSIKRKNLSLTAMVCDFDPIIFTFLA